jgi:hypothetical protein
LSFLKIYAGHRCFHQAWSDLLIKLLVNLASSWRVGLLLLKHGGAYEHVDAVAHREQWVAKLLLEFGSDKRCILQVFLDEVSVHKPKVDVGLQLG